MLALASFLLFSLSTLHGLCSAQVAIIAHRDVPISSISKSRLIDVYTGDAQHWQDGKPIVVYNLKPKCLAKDSFHILIGRTSTRMKSIWMKRMLSGEGDPPESLPSQIEVLRKVARTPGAIGFVSRDSTDVTVKTLIVPDSD